MMLTRVRIRWTSSFRRAPRRRASPASAPCCRPPTVAAGSPQVTAASSTAFVEAGGTGAQTLSLRGLGRQPDAGPAEWTPSRSCGNTRRDVVIRFQRACRSRGHRARRDPQGRRILDLRLGRRGGRRQRHHQEGRWRDCRCLRFAAGRKRRWRIAIQCLVGQGISREAISASLATTTRKSELKQGDRDYFSCGENYMFDPDTGERADVIDPRTGSPACTDAALGTRVGLRVQLHGTRQRAQLPRHQIPNRSGVQLMQYDYDSDLGQYIPGLVADARHDQPAPRASRFFPSARMTVSRTASPTTITRSRTGYR